MLELFGGWLLLTIVGGWIAFMINKRGWKSTQIIAGALLLAALYGNFPTLPSTINQAMNNIVNTFTK